MRRRPLTESFDLTCPYCGSTTTVLLDLTTVGPDFVEDCHVCCAPITVTPLLDDEGEVIGLAGEPENP